MQNFTVQANAVLFVENILVSEFTIEEGSAGLIQVEIIGDNKNQISLTQDGNTVKIVGKNLSSNSERSVSIGYGSIATGNRSVSIGGSFSGVISTGDGNVINQTKFDEPTIVTSNYNSEKSNASEIKIKVFVPKNTGLALKNSNLSSDFPFWNIIVTLLNSNKAKLIINKGSLGAVLSNSSELRVNGMFNNVETSGNFSSECITLGPISGSFIADASNSATIIHTGGITGKERIKETNFGLVKIN